MSGINDPLAWNLIKRQTYTATKNLDGSSSIQSITLLAQSRHIMIGFSNPEAKSNWWLAAYVSMKIFTLPSSTSEFIAAVESARFNCPLGTLSLLSFPNLGLLPFGLLIKFPPWHKQMLVECWWYDGDDFDTTTVLLQQIKIDVEQIKQQLS